MATFYPTNPMYLLGKSFRFTETLRSGQVFEYIARVVGVELPCLGTSFKWSLLLEHDSSREPILDYVDLDSLMFDWGVVHSTPPFEARAFDQL